MVNKEDSSPKERVAYNIYAKEILTLVQTFEGIEVTELPNAVRGMLISMLKHKYILFFDEDTLFNKKMSLEALDEELHRYGFTIKKEKLGHGQSYDMATPYSHE